MSSGDWNRRELAFWLETSGRRLEQLSPLSGDVSPRRYARIELESGERAILASYPEELRESCQRFVRTTRLLEQVEVRVPEVLLADCDRGLMLVEDVGERTLFDAGATPFAERIEWFEEAVGIAARIARVPAAEVSLLSPRLDGELMARELRQSIDLYLEPSGLLVDGLTDLLERLCEQLDHEPARPCHRDFMARNLVPTPPGELAVLDHQDLRLGPPAYDLASLLNDSFFPPAAVEERLLEGALEDADALLSYRRAAVQRTLKAVGTFTAFAERGFDRHLVLIPPTLSRTLLHLSRLPEAQALMTELKARWAPVIAGTA